MDGTWVLCCAYVGLSSLKNTEVSEGLPSARALLWVGWSPDLPELIQLAVAPPPKYSTRALLWAGHSLVTLELKWMYCARMLGWQY